MRKGSEIETMLNEMVKQRLSDYDGKTFLIHMHHGQADSDLIKAVLELIAYHELSATEAKGFLEYMKLVVDSTSYPRLEK